MVCRWPLVAEEESTNLFAPLVIRFGSGHGRPRSEHGRSFGGSPHLCNASHKIEQKDGKVTGAEFNS